ncbi:MAG: SDR family NAD(P)-dependent oxidoreductase [Novosphingobium sp.]|nr:SDR family oxidoreductase [Novosphingobium sp.]
MLLEGKVAIVTGAAGNLGSACACEIAKEGAKVVITDLPGTGLEAIADRIREDCGEVALHEADLASEKDVKALVRSAIEEFGGIDVLVNVAAFMQGIDKDRDLLTMSSEYWDKAMAVNLRGTMLCCKHAIPTMLERGGGAIVNFGSTAGILGDVGLFAYSATKAALLSLTRSIATTYGKQGIRCNSVCPGSVWTVATKDMMPASMLEMMTRTRLTPRLGLPEDVAAMVAFLASDKAEYVTGQTFMVDGGGTAHQPWVRME